MKAEWHIETRAKELTENHWHWTKTSQSAGSATQGCHILMTCPWERSWWNFSWGRCGETFPKLFTQIPSVEISSTLSWAGSWKNGVSWPLASTLISWWNTGTHQNEELKRHCKTCCRRFEIIARWCKITTQRCSRADERDESWNRWVQARGKRARDKSELYVQAERRHWAQLICFISQIVVLADWHRESQNWEWVIRSLDLIVGRSSNKASATNTQKRNSIKVDWIVNKSNRRNNKDDAKVLARSR